MHDVKSYKFVEEYFSNPDAPIKAIVECRRVANKRVYIS